MRTRNYKLGEPVKGIPDSIIPKLDKKILKPKYIHNLEEWRRFSSRIQKNPFVRNFIMDRDGKCRACDSEIKNMEDFRVHHSDYDHVCGFPKTIAVQFKTRIRDLPDCGQCKIDRPDLFNCCMARLAAVHNECNINIERMAKRYVKFGLTPNAEEKFTETEPLSSSFPLEIGSTINWIERNYALETNRKNRRRRPVSGSQRIRASLQFIEGEYIILKIVHVEMLENSLEGSSHNYAIGDIIRRNTDKLFNDRQAKVYD